jgi:hypothetical protein
MVRWEGRFSLLWSKGQADGAVLSRYMDLHSDEVSELQVARSSPCVTRVDCSGVCLRDYRKFALILNALDVRGSPGPIHLAPAEGWWPTATYCQSPVLYLKEYRRRRQRLSSQAAGILGDERRTEDERRSTTLMYR